MESVVINNTNVEKKLETIGWTPLYTRLLAHRIGDGSVNHYGHFDYSNKHINEFIGLANFLKIKYWGPIVSDKYGTHKVIIPKKTFRDFASVFEINHEELIRNPNLLLNTISKLPEEHRFQAILALIVDDGSCTAWMPIIFEDKNKEVFDKVKDLWDSIFPLTSRVYIQKTKKDIKIYHLAINREGIISLILRIEESVNKYGNFANLWWKQNNFNKRYNKAISDRAELLAETRMNGKERDKLIFDYLNNNKYITFVEAQKILNLSKDRTRLVLSNLVKNSKLFLIDAGSKSHYSLTNEDISLEARQRVIVNYLMSNKKIFNSNCRKLLGLGEARVYVILKKLVKHGVIKQIKERGTTHYKLS